LNQNPLDLPKYLRTIRPMSDVVAGILLFLALLGAVFFSFQLVTTLVRFGKIPADWDIRCVTTATLVSLLLILVVEALSLLRLLSAFGLAAGWMIVSALLHRARQNLEQESQSDPVTSPPLPPQAADWTMEEKSLRQGIAWTLAGLFAIAFWTAPTVLDPITFDLTRALHWTQNESVAHFATHDLRQLQAPPFPAFALLHAFLFSKGDQLAPLVPWAALLLTVIAVSTLSGQLSHRLPQHALTRTAKLWSGILTLCLLLALSAVFPNAINFFGTFWIVSLALFGLLLISAPGNIVYATGLGSAFAFSILSNEHLGLPALALGAIVLFIAIKRTSIARMRLLAAFAATAVVLAAPHYLRNLQLFSTITASLPLSFQSQLILLVLIVPFFAFVIARKLGNAAKIALAVVLAFVALASILLNPTRPILGADFFFENRERQRFHGALNLYEPAARAVDDIFISGSTNVALLIRNSSDALAKIDYAVWALFTDRGFEHPLHHVGATNLSARLAAPPPIQALLTSSSNTTEISNYKLIYGPIAAYWTELDSRWIELSHTKPAQRILSSTNQELLEFGENFTTTLSSRVARQGVITLETAFGDRQGLLRTSTVLSVKTPAGFTTTSRSTNAFHTIEIPVPPGQTEIRLTPAFKPSADVVLALRSWTWYPTEQPLPFIYISEVTSPTTVLEPGTLIIGPSSDLTIQLISGAVGVVDLQFFAPRTDAAPLQIANEVFQTNITFRTNTAVARIPVQRGTNRFTAANPSTNTLLLDRIEPRFRDFVE
jgi:hypothetical protein